MKNLRKNIIFIVDAQKNPSGGGKKIYDYSNYINSLNNYSSEITHIKKKKIDYAILVQNAYSIYPTNNFKVLKESYKKAKFIIYYSKEIKNGILRAFPNYKLNLFEFTNAVNIEKINFENKRNIISYMPRKMPLHSFLVTNYLKEYLPKKWKLVPIHNLSSKKTFLVLKKSKIFLSFSFLEGFGMPPLEAALAGNKVIGYTGEAGREYWKEPIFTKVESGNIFKFCDKILKNLNNQNFIRISNLKRKKIIEKYSVNLEHKKIDKFLSKINQN